MKKQTPAEQNLDALLSISTVNAPENFSDEVVARISAQPQNNVSTEATRPISPTTPATPIWQWFALGTASLAGAFQMIGFVFGIWAATTAG